MNDEIVIDGVKYRRVEEQAEPAPAFAVGDWVEAVSDDRGGRFKKGAQGIIEKPFVNRDGFYVDWKMGTFNTHHPYYKQAFTHELRKIAPPQAEPSPAFAVGDWVEAIGKGSPGFVKPGAKGIIKRPSKAGWWVEWKSGEFSPCSDNEWSIEASFLRHIPPPIPAGWTAASERPDDARKVEIMFDDYSQCYGRFTTEWEQARGDGTYFGRLAYQPLCWRDIPAPAPEKPPLKYKVGDVVLVPVRVVEVEDGTKFPYHVVSVTDIADDAYFTRAALEPPAPTVGQRVIGWSSYTGKLQKADKTTLPYCVGEPDEFDWFTHAVALD